MNNQTESFETMIKDWGFEDFLPTFVKHNVDRETILLMNECDLNIIFGDDIGNKARFRFKIECLKRQVVEQNQTESENANHILNTSPTDTMIANWLIQNSHSNVSTTTDSNFKSDVSINEITGSVCICLKIILLRIT